MDKKTTSKEAIMLATLATLSIKNNKMDFTNNLLVAVTAAGIIQGTPVFNQDKEALERDNSYLLFENIGTLAKEESSDSLGAILLQDATISNYGVKTTFNYLYLFIDDVIALSFGVPDNN